MKKYWIAVCFAVFLLTGCTAKINSTLQLNGQPFVPTGCRSGQAFGFSGVEFTDKDGVRLRLLANADGTCSAALFKAGSAKGDAFGPCGTLAMKTQSSRINSIHNLEGAANLMCRAAARKIEGSIQFENCH